MSKGKVVGSACLFYGRKAMSAKVAQLPVVTFKMRVFGFGLDETT